MQLIDSTYEILHYKVNNYNFDERLVDWAIDMLETGFDSEHLRILAGITKPYNHFYLNELAEKTFKELNIEYSDKERINNEYINYLITGAINGKEDLLKVLNVLKNLCISEDYERKLMDFYLLYWAKDDLISSEVQWYWPDANRNNIDKIIIGCFKEWKNKYDAENQ